MMKQRFLLKMILALFLVIEISAVWADPPAHAPAHGWRRKHDPNYAGYTGKKWEQDYGVVSGHCNTDAVGAVIGAAVGGIVGSKVSKGDNKMIAILVGTAVGAILGAKIGRSLDEKDYACIGHALELGKDHQSIVWDNGPYHYTVIPLKSERKTSNCRDFDFGVKYGNENKWTRKKACRRQTGDWELLY